MDVRCVGSNVPTLSNVQITIVMQAPSTIGGFTSSASVDPYNKIIGSNESNNTETTSFSTYHRSAPSPDGAE